MKTEKELSLNVQGLFTKISNDDLRHNIKVAFAEYRDEVYKRLLSCNQNLGHTAYGHSSSTSIGIDNLRNSTFDFLEIPEK